MMRNMEIVLKPETTPATNNCQQRSQGWSTDLSCCAAQYLTDGLALIHGVKVSLLL